MKKPQPLITETTDDYYKSRCKNCATDFADIAEKEPGYCTYCTDNDLISRSPVANIGGRYQGPAIVTTVARPEGGLAYQWNKCGVCVNPDLVYHADRGRWDNLELHAALRPDGKWAAAFDYNYSKGGPGGGGGPVASSGPGYDSKQAAVQAVAAGLLQQPRIEDLHPSLRAALAVIARSVGLLVPLPALPPVARNKRPVPVQPSQLALF
jgi:hypothetical protein